MHGFDEQVPNLYDEVDRERGFIEVADRRGVLHEFPFVTISLGVASTEVRAMESPAEVATVAAEMKRFAKRAGGSIWRMDRRRT